MAPQPAPPIAAAPRVRRLPDPLVDQIAAGEVVERPASVVKELVENALDARATRVRVEVRDGGSAWIAVTDDGHGMSPEDARLALERHATSKLARAADLQRIESYGFRGEALPAIASVSRLRLRTRLRGDPEAHELCVEDGKLLLDRATGAPEGTRVEVAELFARVPARRKFLKAASTEWGHVADWLARAALARPRVHFDLQRDDRPAIAWPAVEDPLDRIAAVLSEDEAAALVAVERTEGAARLHGFVSRPDWHRATGEGIHLFVNARPVRDRLLRHAVLDVVRDLLPRGRFPAAVLFLELPFDAVDVNVHPAKWEVRFAEPRAIHHLVASGLRDAVMRRSWLAPAGGVGHGGDARPESGRGAASGAASDWVFARAATGQLAEIPAAPDLFAPAPGAPSAAPGVRFAALRAVGQLLATYLVAEGEGGFLLVDQHAAHERVLYERLRAGWRGGRLESQALLAPLALELGASAASALAASSDVLAALGFEVEPFGDASVAVRAIPALLAGHDPAPLVRSLADELRDDARLGTPSEAGPRALEALDRVFATLACHSARRKGDVLDPREQRALLDALDTIPWAPTCPHGRPVAVPFERAEIERRFGRR
jgi:DNA mismatch repair protein MutL